MENGVMNVKISKSDLHAQIQRIFNLGQATFVKLLDSYDCKLKDGKVLEDYVKRGSDGIDYFEFPHGKTPPVIRFEINPENAEKSDPKNIEMKKKFDEIEKVSIREPINQALGGVETLFKVKMSEIKKMKNEGKTEDEISQETAESMEEIRREAIKKLGELRTSLDPSKVNTEDFKNFNKIMDQALDGLGEIKSLDNDGEEAFKKIMKSVRGFITQKEQAYIQS